MDSKSFCLAVFVAAAYVAWPNLAKPMGIKPGVVPFVVIIVAFFVTLIMAPKDIAEIRTISPTKLTILIAFSIANGVAIYLFAAKAADPKVQTGMFLVTVFILEVVFAPIVDYTINRVKPSGIQFAGLTLAPVVMWMLAQGKR